MFWTRSEQTNNNMSSFSVEPHGVDQQSLHSWKTAWLQLWKDEKDPEKNKVVKIINRESDWDTHERNIPWFPEHYEYCIIDESMAKVQNWKH